jgi:predicted O-methyltransferase YrrM
MVKPIGNKNPKMHFHEEFLKDHDTKGFISDKTMMKWFLDEYSTSKHLLVLYSIVKGLKAKKVLEVGYGRSTSVLARAVNENGGKMVCCDWDDFSRCLSHKEKKVVKYIFDNSSVIWANDEGFDFAFLDHFGKEGLKVPFLFNEIENCLTKMKTNGIVAMHDSFVDSFRMRKAVELLKDREDVEYVTLPYNYGLTILRYKGESKYGRIKDNLFYPKKSK